MTEFDPDGPEAMYKAIARVLRARIADGTYPVDRPIPSEAEIRAEFGVGRTTARSAVEILTDEGLVQAQQGKGVFVLKKPED